MSVGVRRRRAWYALNRLDGLESQWDKEKGEQSEGERRVGWMREEKRGADASKARQWDVGQAQVNVGDIWVMAGGGGGNQVNKVKYLVEVAYGYAPVTR